MYSHYPVILIGGSSGSLCSIKDIVSSLPAGYPYAIVIVLHYMRGSDELMKNGIQLQTSQLNVIPITDKLPLRAGSIYLAPSDYHVLLEDGEFFALSLDEKVHYCRPAIDVLFSTAAEVLTNRCVGVLLSGANDDGAEGLLDIKKRGGVAIVQSPESAEVDTMPKAAIALDAQNFIYTPADIRQYLLDMQSKPIKLDTDT